MEGNAVKKKSIVYFLLISVIGFKLGLGGFLTVSAEEIGQVQTSAGIGFYESSTESSSSAENTATTSQSQSDISTKPKGRYPSTGELVKKSVALSGVVLIVFVVLFILWKRKKKKQTENRKEE
nr:LPXTG cell wall anchor domain-containing protein [Enterococcus sp. DIV0212c]